MTSSTNSIATDLRVSLDRIYNRFNRREYVHPDPLEFIYEYDKPEDQEIVGLVASSLAYGRVAGILKSVGYILDRMGPSPRGFLLDATRSSLSTAFNGFKHRFTTGDDMANLLWGARGVIRRHGSLNECFLDGMGDDDETVAPALARFVRAIDNEAEAPCGFLLPSPNRGSACKRPSLFLRWMVRDDAVDPGCWEGISCFRLLVPLDTHMHRVSRDLGFTSRSQADLRTVLLVTEAFRRVSPHDPVKYDFALTRPGIANIPAELFETVVKGHGKGGNDVHQGNAY